MTLATLHFGQSTLVIQGAKHKNVVNQAVNFNPAMNGTHVSMSPVTVDGDMVKVTITGPAKGEITSDKSDFNYDPEREAVSGLTCMLKIAGVPMQNVTLESENRPDLADTFVKEFRDKL